MLRIEDTIAKMKEDRQCCLSLSVREERDAHTHVE